MNFISKYWSQTYDVISFCYPRSVSTLLLFYLMKGFDNMVNFTVDEELIIPV